MAYSYETYTASGSNDTFNVPCPYLAKSHVHVYLDGVETSAFTWATTSSIKLNAVPAAGVKVKVQRITPFTAPLVDFVNGTISTAEDLDTLALQAIYLTQENADNGNLAADIFDQFDDRYLGSKAADPALDNDGNALQEGAIYWNSTSKTLRVYNGAAWTNVATFTLPLSVSNGGTGSTSAADARTALGATAVGAAVFTAVDEAAARAAIGVGVGTVANAVRWSNTINLVNDTPLTLNLGNGTFEYADEVWYNAGNPTRLTPGVAGRYRVTMTVAWGTTGAGSFSIHTAKNGGVSIPSLTSRLSLSAFTGMLGPCHSFSDTIVLTNTDYLEFTIEQVTGGTVNSIPITIHVERVK